MVHLLSCFTPYCKRDKKIGSQCTHNFWWPASFNSGERDTKNISINWINPYHDYEILTRLGDLGKNIEINSMLIKTKNRHKVLSADELAIYNRQLEQFGIIIVIMIVASGVTRPVYVAAQNLFIFIAGDNWIHVLYY